jgi:hypothetical protein
VYGEEEITISNQSTNMVYNGTFDSADGWNGSTITISGGQATWTSANPYASMWQFDIPGEGPMTPLATSTSYNLSFTIVSYSGGSNAFMAFSNSNNTVSYVGMSGYSTGNHTVGFTTPGTLDTNGLRILINNEEGNTQIVFDNISIVAQ